MAQPDLGKDLLLMHARMFNHRGVLSGEQKHFIKEFETKRNNRESTRINEIVSIVDKIGHSLPECCEQSTATRLELLQQKINNATEKANEILTRETDNHAMRKVNNEKREAEWVCFLNDMEKAQNDVERLHKERMLEFKQRTDSSSSS